MLLLRLYLYQQSLELEIKQFISSKYMLAFMFFIVSCHIKTSFQQCAFLLLWINGSIHTYLAFCFNGERQEFPTI